IRRSLPGAIHDQELVLDDKRLRNYGTDAARTEQASQGSNEVDKKNDQIAHRRIVAGREILRKYGRNNNSPATGELSRPKRFSLPLSAFRAMYKMPTSTRKALPCRAEASNLAGAGKLAMARCERPSGVDRHRLG